MEQLLNIIRNFSKSKVLVVGDVMLDEYITGQVNRISPEAPVPVLDVQSIHLVPGGAANAARNVKALGAEVVLAGTIGLGERGKKLKEVLGKAGISSQGIVLDKDRKTNVKTRIIARSQQIIRVDSEDRNFIGQETKEKILNFVSGQLKGINVILISDYAKGVITPDISQNIIGLARQNKILCVVDPKGDDYLKYRGCNMVTPNQRELGQALNLTIENEGKFLQAGKMLLSHVMCDNILVTRHEKGMSLFTRDGKVVHHPALNKKVIDVSGAGDTAIATFALALAAGSDLERAMTLASHACSIVVGKRGTAVASPQELEKSLKGANQGL